MSPHELEDIRIESKGTAASERDQRMHRDSWMVGNTGVNYKDDTVAGEGRPFSRNWRAGRKFRIPDAFQFTAILSSFFSVSKNQ
jgi:hypothetical protein